MKDIKYVDRRTLRFTQCQEQHGVRLVYLLGQFNSIVNIKQVILMRVFLFQRSTVDINSLKGN